MRRKNKQEPIPLRQIKLKRKARLKELSEHLLNDETHLAGEDLKWIKLADDTLKLMPDRKKSVLWPILIGGLCMLLVGLGFLRMPSTTIHLDLKATEIHLKLAESLGSEEVFDPNILIENANRVSFIGLTQINGLDADNPGLLKGEGKDFQLEIPNFQAGQRLAFEHGIDQQGIAFKTLGYSTELHVGSGILVSDLLDEETIIIEEEIPETYELTAEESSSLSSIQWSPSQTFALANLPVSGISFFEEAGEFMQSAVLGGSITLIATEEKTEIVPRDEIRVTLLNNRNHKIDFLKASAEGLEIKMSATVDDITLGPENFQKSLMPTLFEYMRGNQQMTLIWSVILWAWGMLWSIKRTLF